MGIDLGIFDRIMDNGEYIEWVGKAEPFKLADAANKKALNIRWLICAAVAVILTAVYIISTFSRDLEIQTVIPVITICVPLFIALRPMLDKGTINKKLIFALTNKRAIVYKSETDYSGMALDKTDAVKFTDKGSGIGDVVLGKAAVEAPESKLRYIALVPKTSYNGDEKLVTGLVFYNIAEIGKVKELLEQKIQISAK